MTPAAKPVNARCRRSPMAFFIKNTQAEPKAVPKKESECRTRLLRT